MELSKVLIAIPTDVPIPEDVNAKHGVQSIALEYSTECKQ